MVKIILITTASVFVNVSVVAQKRVPVIRSHFEKSANSVISKMILSPSPIKPRTGCFEVELKDRFENNRGSLPWPVNKGYVRMNFGPVIPSCVYIDNPGLTIGTDIGQPVKAVFGGIVSGVFRIDEMQIVILQHGRYFTAYSNINNVCVSKGQAISTGQVLGNAMANDDGVGEIDFILCNEKSNFDPLKWLMKEPVPSKAVSREIEHSNV